MNNVREITFEIVEEIGVISAHSTGWNKELNLVSWNGNPAKYDIRDWSPDHEQMCRGITLTEAEMKALVEAYVYKHKGLDIVDDDLNVI